MDYNLNICETFGNPTHILNSYIYSWSVFDTKITLKSNSLSYNGAIFI
jgi:hypothetical protein